jgi:hypothetical protein
MRHHVPAERPHGGTGEVLLREAGIEAFVILQLASQDGISGMGA